MGCYAENDEMFTIALRYCLFNIKGIIWCDIIVIETMLILISFMILLSAIEWKYPMFDIPTLLTKMDTFKP